MWNRSISAIFRCLKFPCSWIIEKISDKQSLTWSYISEVCYIFHFSDLSRISDRLNTVKKKKYLPLKISNKTSIEVLSCNFKKHSEDIKSTTSTVILNLEWNLKTYITAYSYQCQKYLPSFIWAPRPLIFLTLC